MHFIVERKTLISMLFIALTLLGVISYKNLSVELLPNTEYPMLFVSVNTTQEVDPRYLEQEGVIPLEGVVGTLENVEKIESQVSASRGDIAVYLSKEANIKYAYLKLVEKVNGIKSGLPEDFRVAVSKMDLGRMSMGGGTHFMRVQVRGEGGVDRVRNITDKSIVEKFESVDGVAGVDVYGGQQKTLEVIVDEEVLLALNLTINDIRKAITTYQAEKSFAGEVYHNDKRLFVNICSEYRSVADIENVVVSADGTLFLKDIAVINHGVKEKSSYSRVNGMETVSLSITKEAEANLIEVAQKVREVVEQLNRDLKIKGVEVVVATDSAEIIEKNIDNIIQLALIGGLLAIFVLWVFLRNVPLVSIVMLSIPVSVYAAFNFFYAFDISINILTLIGIALAIGMLIDNSVVVLENIYRVAATGKTVKESVVQGTREIYRAVIAATLTTVFVFLPFVFSENVLFREVARHISVSIISTLLISLFVALLLIPMLAYVFIGRQMSKNGGGLRKITSGNVLIQRYVVLLKNALRKPSATITWVLVLFFVTVILSVGMSITTTREVETAEFIVDVEMPSGATLAGTDAIVRQLEEEFGGVEEVDEVIVQVYEESAAITLKLQEQYEEVEGRSLPEIKSEVQKIAYGIEGSDITLSQGGTSSGMSGGFGQGNSNAGMLSMMGVGAQTEKILIKGEDFDKMLLLAEDIKYYLEENLEDIEKVVVSASQPRPEMHLEFDPGLMSLYGITPNDVATQLFDFRREVTSGGKLKIDNEEYDIIIKTAQSYNFPEAKKSADELKQLNVASSSGGLVALRDFTDISYGFGRAKITRVNQGKQIEVKYRFPSEVNASKELLEDARLGVDELISDIALPAGLALEVVHEEDTFEEFYFLFGVAFILIFMILASVFESFISPVVMMFSVPLAAIGSFWGLIFTGNTLFNLNSLIGFLILLGVVVNNGIILIDYSRLMRKQGMRHSRALILAGISRLRPIVITATTTIFALLPLAMGQSEYVGSLGAPFAITVIGGLTVSTLLTLVFIPTLGFGLENSLKWINQLPAVKKMVIFFSWITGGGYLFWMADLTFVYQLLWFVVLIVAVPGVLYFLMSSLKQARENLIPDGTPITIRIQNLVKIYERDSRFVREWKEAGRNRLKENDSVKVYWQSLVWKLPLFLFWGYFTWFYLTSEVWNFVFALIGFFGVRALVMEVATRFLKIQGAFLTRKRVEGFLLWGYPVVAIALFAWRWGNLAAVVVVGVLWGGALLVIVTAQKLNKTALNVERLSGRWAGWRRRWFLFVRNFPIIGQKREPFKALKGVSIEMKTGMIGLLGPNGAGKTTMMRIICGILEQSYGKVFINGYDTQEKREELQGLIGYLPQEFGTYENMSAWEFLNYMALLKGIVKKEVREKRVDDVLAMVHMVDRKNHKIGSFSGGMKQRIGIAQILLHLPKILVVDEPTAGLDPRERIRFRNLLVELSRERIVIFSTHIIEDISSSCNQVAVLNKGELKYWGEPKDMSRFAEGKVWMVNLPASEIDEFSKQHVVVHHMSSGEMVHARVIAGDAPREGAVLVNAVLEDSYLWLLKSFGKRDK